jgi:parallel beta-helix repeat protein
MLLLLGTIIPVSATTLSDNMSKSLTKGITLYVGGSGPNNYTKIQDAIDDASDEDTIFVFDDSSPYDENIVIEKSLTLKGENKFTTVILGDAQTSGGIINISANDVTISGFTIQPHIARPDGIGVNNNYRHPDYWNITTITNVTIYDNIIKNTSYGICGSRLTNGNIYKNTIENCYTGITLFISSNNTITKNLLVNCGRGITIYGVWSELILENYLIMMHHCNPKPENNIISQNTIKSNEWGIFLYQGCKNTKVFENNITDSSEFGIMISNAVDTEITRNNFIRNYKNAHFSAERLRFSQFLISKQSWNQNYWGGPKKVPVIIPGTLTINIFPRIPISFNIEHFNFPLIAFDKNPTQEPYDILVFGE